MAAGGGSRKRAAGTGVSLGTCWWDRERSLKWGLRSREVRAGEIADMGGEGGGRVGVLEVGDGAEALQGEQRLWAPDLGPAVAQTIGVQGSVTTRKDAQCLLSFHVACWLECAHGFGQMLSGAHG